MLVTITVSLSSSRCWSISTQLNDKGSHLGDAAKAETGAVIVIAIAVNAAQMDFIIAVTFHPQFDQARRECAQSP